MKSHSNTLHSQTKKTEVRQLEMREGYETKVATLLSLGFDTSVDECYNALVSSAGNMERAVEILLKSSQRGAGEDASTPLIEVEEEGSQGRGGGRGREGRGGGKRGN